MTVAGEFKTPTVQRVEPDIAQPGQLFEAGLKVAATKKSGLTSALEGLQKGLALSQSVQEIQSKELSIRQQDVNLQKTIYAQNQLIEQTKQERTALSKLEMDNGPEKLAAIADLHRTLSPKAFANVAPAIKAELTAMRSDPQMATFIKESGLEQIYFSEELAAKAKAEQENKKLDIQGKQAITEIEAKGAQDRQTATHKDQLFGEDERKLYRDVVRLQMIGANRIETEKVKGEFKAQHIGERGKQQRITEAVKGSERRQTQREGSTQRIEQIGETGKQQRITEAVKGSERRETQSQLQDRLDTREEMKAGNREDLATLRNTLGMERDAAQGELQAQGKGLSPAEQRARAKDERTELRKATEVVVDSLEDDIKRKFTDSRGRIPRNKVEQYQTAQALLNTVKRDIVNIERKFAESGGRPVEINGAVYSADQKAEAIADTIRQAQDILELPAEDSILGIDRQDLGRPPSPTETITTPQGKKYNRSALEADVDRQAAVYQKEAEESGQIISEENMVVLKSRIRKALLDQIDNDPNL